MRAHRNQRANVRSLSLRKHDRTRRQAEGESPRVIKTFIVRAHSVLSNVYGETDREQKKERKIPNLGYARNVNSINTSAPSVQPRYRGAHGNKTLHVPFGTSSSRPSGEAVHIRISTAAGLWHHDKRLGYTPRLDGNACNVREIGKSITSALAEVAAEYTYAHNLYFWHIRRICAELPIMRSQETEVKPPKLMLKRFAAPYVIFAPFLTLSPIATAAGDDKSFIVFFSRYRCVYLNDRQ